MRRLGIPFALALSLAWFLRAALADVQPAGPEWLLPGRTTRVKVKGRSLAGAVVAAEPRDVRVYVAGSTAEGGELDVEVLADAPTGPRSVVLEFPNQTMETLRLFVETPAPEIDEREPNNSLLAPQALPMNGASVKGKLDGDGADVFQFHSARGQRWRIELFAHRIGSPLEGVVRVRDPRGARLRAVVDRGRDCGLDFVAPEDGNYLIEVFDGENRAQADFVYRLSLRPVPPSS